MVALAPAIYDLLRSFRLRFAFMTAAALSAVCIVLLSNIYLLIPSMVLLGIYLIIHLYRSLRRAYRSSIFEGLSDLVRKLRVSIEDGQQTLWKKEKYKPQTKDYEQQCLMFYLLNSVTEIVGDRLLKVAKSRKPDLYLMISWLTTVLLTSLVYSSEYWSLYKLDTHSFTASYTLSFWSFWGFSFGKLHSLKPFYVGSDNRCSNSSFVFGTFLRPNNTCHTGLLCAHCSEREIQRGYN